MSTYTERWEQAKADDVSLTVFVPATDMLSIAPRSAIVGKRLIDQKWLIHYEGWVHGAMQYEDLDARGQWEAGVRHAAGRALTEYPTSARMVAPSTQLRAVGIYSARTDTIILDDEEAVTNWLT